MSLLCVDQLHSSASLHRLLKNTVTGLKVQNQDFKAEEVNYLQFQAHTMILNDWQAAFS